MGHVSIVSVTCPVSTAVVDRRRTRCLLPAANNVCIDPGSDAICDHWHRTRQSRAWVPGYPSVSTDTALLSS
eukprot:3643846-Rhodomonas_salina.1